ncbi:hypothetical protein DRE_02189 [Drechslerella stenobrocha 248]|uniref:Caffeine-induced death protein Cid2 n=1 Tax=Drechslerella stenobrocha 248 TaxID=1043628 RepID=W7IGS1_9PEZI|nr:hypothetical protein DRE_02189 [Drechslerella stenobrocha 248]
MTSHADAPAPPPLTPGFCFSTSTLKDFLRASRATTDDSISQQLNTLARPPTFNPTTTSSRQPSHRLIPRSTMTEFLHSTLYPSWSARTQVLRYCASVAAAPDPDDPAAADIARANEAHKEKVVDERLDPYSGRWFPRESRTEVLAGVVRNESGVEDIVRERTWDEVRSRTADGMGGLTWEQAYEQWRQQRQSSDSGSS